MTRIRRLFTLAIAILILGSTGFAQDRGERPNRQQGDRQQRNFQNMSAEEINKQQSEIVKEKIASFQEKTKGVFPEDKQAAIDELVKQHFIGEARLRVSAMLARQKAGNDRQKARAIMMGVRKKTEELIAGTKSAAKKQLDKKTLQKFNKAIDELTPMGGPGGRGGPGGGGRGGQGGGGGGR